MAMGAAGTPSRSSCSTARGLCGREPLLTLLFTFCLRCKHGMPLALITHELIPGMAWVPTFPRHLRSVHHALYSINVIFDPMKTDARQGKVQTVSEGP
jgi:hypothetical protein